MRRGPKPAKSKEAKLPVVRKSPQNDGAKVRDLENLVAAALRDKAEAQEQLQIRDRELAEARERETATGATLRVISSAPADLEQVFHTLLTNAARLCEAQLALLFRYEAGLFQLMGHHGDTRSADFAATAFPRDPFTASPSIGLGRIAHELRPVQIADLTQDSAYTEREPLRVVTVEIGGCRTWLGVPMLKDGHLVGAFVLWRREVQPFTDRQIGLVSTFADQAAIAIENVRLFSETKEALERQTATAEILRVISSSPTDIQRVFETIAEAALRFFGAWGVLVFRYDEGLARLAAVRGGQPGSAEALLERSVPSPPVKGTFLGETILRRTAQQIVDVETDTVFGPALRANARERGWRSGCQVPMLRGSDVLGVIAVSRTEPGPFSSDDIALLQTFADQAVIAIENVRLFKELQEKNRALTEAHAQVSESLEQQTATAEILRVISSSPTDIQPVLDAVAENAAHICAGADAHIRLIEGDTLRAVARFGTAPFRAPD
ncbi:MAG TPA: GAF domain-containing protein, partial [Gemmataceae bacterium]|nr:GAF domain-containing protein [Gemmataceae bacterium]